MKGVMAKTKRITGGMQRSRYLIRASDPRPKKKPVRPKGEPGSGSRSNSDQLELNKSSTLMVSLVFGATTLPVAGS